MNLDYLYDKFHENLNKEAIIWNNQSYTYKWLLTQVNAWKQQFSNAANIAGKVVGLKVDFSPVSVALLIALIENKCIIVPLTQSIKDKFEEFCAIAEIELMIEVNEDDIVDICQLELVSKHELIAHLKQISHPGLILFSSGSTGKSKAALHDFAPLLQKFEIARHSKRIITFLLFDHIGGINTLFYTRYNGGCIIAISNRSSKSVCEAIQNFGAQILPTSPTFLNLLLINGDYKNYNLKHLETITYGTEAMSKNTLARLHDAFPHTKLQQTYGLSEIGIMRSKSESSDSLYMKIGGEGYDLRVADGLLEIKAKSAMLGYLNAASPFTEDGWFKTGDMVELKGEYIKILGRQSEIINVGGMKVYPTEIENIIQQMDGVGDVVVSGEYNLITGYIVKAKINLFTDETLSDFRLRMKEFCRERLDAYKIPQKIVITNEFLYSSRFKKMRKEN